jgi:MscS family membrane protein
MDWSTQVFGNSIHGYAIFFGVLALGALLGKLTAWLLQNIIRRIAKHTQTKFDDVLVDVFDGPLVLAVFIATLAFSKHLLILSPTMAILYSHMIRILITVNIAWLIIRFVDSMLEHYMVPYASQTETDLDDVLLPILRSVAKVIVIVMAGIMVLSDFGFNVVGLVAGLGIGGLAIAFAAKDLISNIFGGVSVIADKPFKIGDTIKFGDKTGVVREIGIRTTRLLTVDGTTLIIPNAKFTDGIIENMSERPKDLKQEPKKAAKAKKKARKGRKK